jgi:MerR family transcriptional regulator, copper efflux regulator
MAQPLTIGQLAKASGMAAKTIRYYEEVGVLRPPNRSQAGYRQYDHRAVERLLFVRRARGLGLSLQHLKTLTASLDGPRPTLRPRLRVLVRAHLSAVQQQIAELHLLQQQLEQVLHRLLTSSPGSHAAGCRCFDGATNLPVTDRGRIEANVKGCGCPEGASTRPTSNGSGPRKRPQRQS